MSTWAMTRRGTYRKVRAPPDEKPRGPAYGGDYDASTPPGLDGLRPAEIHRAPIGGVAIAGVPDRFVPDPGHQETSTVPRMAKICHPIVDHRRDIGVAALGMGESHADLGEPGVDDLLDAYIGGGSKTGHRQLGREQIAVTGVRETAGHEARADIFG